MSNKYKFRAWDSENNEFIYSERLDGECFYVNTNGVLFMYAHPKSETGLDTKFHKSYDHVGMFSGLQDSEGTDIYEGDIVRISGYGDYEAQFPFIELYEAYPENDIGKIAGHVYAS